MAEVGWVFCGSIDTPKYILRAGFGQSSGGGRDGVSIGSFQSGTADRKIWKDGVFQRPFDERSEKWAPIELVCRGL